MVAIECATWQAGLRDRAAKLQRFSSVLEFAQGDFQYWENDLFSILQHLEIIATDAEGYFSKAARNNLVNSWGLIHQSVQAKSLRSLAQSAYLINLALKTLSL